MKQHLVLASSSSSRLKILHQCGIIPDEIFSSNINEDRKSKEKIEHYLQRMILTKLEKAKEKYKTSYIIVADTVLTKKSSIYQKPKDISEALKFLDSFSGKSINALTAYAIHNPSNITATKLVKTKIFFKKITQKEKENYLGSNIWQNKAGGFSIEEGEHFVQKIIGSYSNIIGLPTSSVINTLAGLGYIL